LRTALALKPGSKEAKKIGCICQEGCEPIDECPIHFPIRYIKKMNVIEYYIQQTIGRQNITSRIIIALLIIDIMANFLKG
jgi:hypothetical protein